MPPYAYASTVARDPGGSKSASTITRTFNVTGSRLVTLVVTDETGSSITTFTINSVDEIEVPPIPKTKRRAVRK